MVSRRNKELTDADIQKIAGTYHNWRNVNGGYEDVAGFCRAARMDEVRANNYVLMPGRYVGTEAEEDDGVLFADKIAALTSKLAEQFSKGHTLETEIRENLKSIGYEF